MKKFLCVIVAVLMLMAVLSSLSLCADESCPYLKTQMVVPLRLGGGGSGSGGSGGGSSGGSGSHSGMVHHGGAYYGRGSVISDILSSIFFVFALFGSVIIYRFRISKYARNTRKLMKMLNKKDSAWKFKNIQKRVREIFYALQNAWSNSDLTPTKHYLSDELFESYQTKLLWMKYRKQRNVLKNIKLTEAVPVSLYDSDNDREDYVWFYIKGRMVDYIIDTETNLKISGNTATQSFVEYWQFVRNENGAWILNKILQKDEADEIIFCE